VIITAGGECHLHPRGAGWQPEARIRPAPGENQAAGPLDNDELPFAELPRRDLEPEAAPPPRLEISGDPDPADQLPGVGEHVKHLLNRCWQDEFLDHRIAVDHCRVSCPEAPSSARRLASRL